MNFKAVLTAVLIAGVATISNAAPAPADPNDASQGLTKRQSWFGGYIGGWQNGQYNWHGCSWGVCW
jgi:hypothetical protein